MSYRTYNPLPEPKQIETIQAGDTLRRKLSVKGSDGLLHAQISSGQHFLGPVALAALKQAKGW